MATTRIYWTLRIEGQPRVSILNGGDHAWQSVSADPVAHGPAKPRAAAFVPHRQAGFLATLAMVKSNLTSHKYQLVDARSVAQFEGKAKSPVALKAGTLPGAHSLPYSELKTADHEGIRDRAALLAGLRKAHIVRNRAAITFCNTGHLASLDWFVLREALGNRYVRLYDGSMAEWTRHPSLPVVPGKVAARSAQR
jgi:thiosulfate/3-mercaptopyruvate sulfurtransferase